MGSTSSLKGFAVKNKLLIPMFAAGLLGAVLTATEAAAADPAPTDVTIAWKDSSHQHVRVTWSEAGDLPNKVVLLRPGGTVVNFAPKFVAAGAPNVVEYAASELGPFYDTLQIGVAAGTEAGVTSAVSASAPFDTIDAGFASRVSATMAGSSTVTVRWKQYPRSEQDVTPNDPLDLTDSVTYTPHLVAGGKTTQLAPASKATEVTVAGRALPYQIDVVTSNEWGTSSARVASAGDTALKAVIPTWVKSGSPASQPAITGTFGGKTAPIYLQARNTATSAWYTVASQQSYNGTFKFELGAVGSRQYRVLVPNHLDANSGAAYFGNYSPTVAMTVQANPWSVGFNPGTVRRGQTSMAAMFHSPAAVYSVILQRWTGTTWSTVGPVKTASGYARGYVKGAAPGRVAYRYYLPATTVKGLWYAAAYSPNFVLTTTP